MQTKKPTDIPKREFAFSHEFPNEVTLALKAYDRVFKELTSINAGKNECKEDYGICNNLYKFRYITPSDIATYTSNLIKVLHSHMIHPQIADLEKFSVMSVKQFMIDHSCVPIEHSSIYGLYNYTTDNMTLKDLLVLCENDFYHTTVVSKYEMQQRAKAIKDDYKTIADMHFSTNIQKIIEGLPNLMNQTEFASMPYLEQKVIQTYIEEFILFTIMMNTVIMSNMIFFCVPKSTFDTRLMDGKSKYDTNNLIPDENVDDDVVTESVDLTKSHDIYIVLTEGTEWVSKQVKKHTMSRFSHAGLSFDPSLRKVYSFGMSNPLNEDTKSDNGFRMDDMGNDHHKGVEFTVYGAYVTEDQYKLMKKYADEIKNAPKTKYSIGSVIRQLFNDDKPVNRKSSHQICSTFVNEILKHANINVTEKNYPAPGDFEKSVMTKMNMFEHVYSGTYDEYDEEDVMERMRAFAERSKSKRLEKGGNVVTECCLLKTNTMRCTSKLPFDINMRNIVLQDMHPHFKDTVSAIEFITTDTRSPIAQMLYRYGHPSEVINGLDGMMICKMFMNGHCGIEMNYDELNNKLHETDFHTDVNWLDKIAYGNTFIDGDYRGEDAVGNDHRHPIQQTLEMLYRMFTEKDLTTKEELSEHIIKIAHLMKSICESYGACGMNNWEMVRDILAVLGEIMTRAMIKLYTNHMTIIASDNMDDVDAPGYMYTESFFTPFEIEEFHTFVMEASDSNSSKEKKEKPSVSSGKAKTIKEHIKKLIEWIKRMINKFISWIQNTLSKLGISFAKNHKQEIEFVKKNSELNHQISEAIKAGKFKPTIVGWPRFKLQVKNITKKKMFDIIKHCIDSGNTNDVPTTFELKKMYYPDEVIGKLSGDKSTSPKPKPDENKQKELLPTSKPEDNKTNQGENNEAIAEYFSRKIENQTIFTESFDTSDKHPVFVILHNHDITEKESKVTKGILMATGSSVSHCVISLDPKLELCYSITPFSNIAKDAIPAMVTKNDNITKRPKNAPHEVVITAEGGPKHGRKLAPDYYGSEENEPVQQSSIIVYGAWLTQESYEKLNKFLHDLRANVEKVKYSWAEIAKSFFKTDKKLDTKGAPKDVRNSYVCSSIVIAALHAAGVEVTNRSSGSPNDVSTGALLAPDRWIKVFQGDANDYRENTAMSKLQAMAKEITAKTAENVETAEEITARNIADKENLTNNAKLLSNYFLYGTTDKPEPAKELSVELWDELVDNLLDSGKALEIISKLVSEDLNKSIALLKEEINHISSRMINDTRDLEQYTSYEYNGGIAPNWDPLTENTITQRKLAQAQALLKSVMEISNEYTSAFTNALQNKFYMVSYNLYRDTITVFKGQHHTKEERVSKQPTTKEKKEPTLEKTSKSKQPSTGMNIPVGHTILAEA